MTRLLFLFSILLLSFQAHSQTPVATFQVSSGTVKQVNWRPDQGQLGPSISSIAIKYKFEPTEEACKVTMSMQWYLGSSAFVNGQELKSPYISSSELSKFSIITIKVLADVYTGSSNVGKITFDLGKTPTSGGVWGVDISEKRAWASVIDGKPSEVSKLIMKKSITLKNLRIQQIDFGGTEQFKQSAYDRLLAKAEAFEESGKFREALDYYTKANVVHPTRVEAKNKRVALEGRLKRYDEFFKTAENHYKKKEFYAALADYQAAIKEIPGQEAPSIKIGLIKKKIEDFKRIDGEASQLLAEADTWRELRNAEDKFKSALALMPIDQQTYIAQRLEEVDYELGLEYNNFLQDGDKALQTKNYNESAKAFREATLIYPEKPEAKAKKEEVEKTVLKLINKKYTDHISDAIFKRNEAFDKAAAAIGLQNERCFVANAVYFQCQSDYYTALRENAEKEMESQLYEAAYLMPSMICDPANCQPTVATNNASADELLEVSKRKSQLFSEYQHIAFKNYRDEYLDKSIQMNPKNTDAYVFKADLAETSLEKMALLNQALAINPSHEEALSKKDNIKGNFYSEVFEKVAISDIEYLTMASGKGLLRNVTTSGEFNILEYAIHHDQEEALDFLLKNKNTLNSSVNTNVSELLYFAISERVSKSADYLIGNQKANVNYQPEGKDPILVMAVKNNDFSGTQKLLAAGARISVQGTGGNTPLDIAVAKDYPPLVEVLLNKYNQSIPAKYIFNAIENNSRAVLGLLIDAGGNINVTDSDQNTPLHLAIAQKKSGLAQLLIEKGVQVDLKNGQGETPLLIACETTQSSIAELLIMNRHSIDIANLKGETPLYWAIQNNLENVTEIMLSRGVDVVATMEFAKNSAKRSFLEDASAVILKYAITSDNTNLAQTAVEYSPYIGFREKAGEANLLKYAIQKDRMDIFELLLKEDPERKTEKSKFSAMHLAVEEKSMKYTAYLLDHLYNTAAVDVNGLSPLHLAAKVEFVEGISRLAGRFGINDQDNLGMTPLHYAAQTDNPRVVSVVLQNGANKKIKDNRKWNPKKLAKKLKKRNVKSLL